MSKQKDKKIPQILRIISIIILLIPFSLALEDKLIIRLHSPNEVVINLYKHLPKQADYFINYTENVQVTVKDGTATITPLNSFTGSETVIFAVNESVLIEKEELYEASQVVNITKLIQDYPKIISSAKTREMFNETINLLPLLREIEEKPIEKIYSRILEDHLFVVINDEVEINVSIKDDVPTYSIQLLNKQGAVDESALKFNVKKPIMITLVILILIIIAFSIKKATEGLKFKKTKHEKTIKSGLTKIKKMPKATASAHIFYLIETFFQKLGITANSSLSELNNKLHKEGIEGNLKQEILFLFNKLKEGALSEHETELAKRYLKRALKVI